MDSCDSKGHVWRWHHKPSTDPDRPTNTYNYKLKDSRPDILMRLAKRQSLASIAKLYGCSYQAIQRIRNTYGVRP